MRAILLIGFAACLSIPTAGAQSSRASAPGAPPRFFKDPAAALPQEPEPEPLVLASALRAASQHDPDTADKLLKPLQGNNANALRAIVATERALLEKLAEEVTGGRKPTLLLPDPDKPKESGLFQVLEYTAGAKELDVERKPKRIRIAASSVPPNILGESLERQKAPIVDEAKATIGLLTAAWACGRADEKAILARAKGRGFVAETPLHQEIAGHLQLLGSFDRLLTAAGDATVGPAKALAGFESGLGASPKVRASARSLLLTRWKELWRTNAFLSEVLKGGISRTKDGKLRIEYPFDKEGELEDWLRVDSREEKFDLLYYRGEKGTPKVADGMLDMHGCVVLRHLLQFTGDMELEVRAGIYKESGVKDDAMFLIPSHPAAGIFARPGGFALLLRPNGVLEKARGGADTTDKTAMDDHWKALSEEIIKGGALRLIAAGDQVRIAGKSKDYLSVALPQWTERKGAVVLASSADPERYRPRLDRVAIIGTPEPNSFEALGTRWIEKVLKRLTP